MWPGNVEGVQATERWKAIRSVTPQLIDAQHISQQGFGGPLVLPQFPVEKEFGAGSSLPFRETKPYF